MGFTKPETVATTKTKPARAGKRKGLKRRRWTATQAVARQRWFEQEREDARALSFRAHAADGARFLAAQLDHAIGSSGSGAPWVAQWVNAYATLMANAERGYAAAAGAGEGES